MTSNCKEFNFLIDRKAVFTENDIPALAAYNKCLVNEIDLLNTNADSLENNIENHNLEIQSLKEQLTNGSKLNEKQLDKLSTNLDTKIQALESRHEVTVDNFTSMFDAYQSGYSNHLTALSVILALSGLLFFFGLGVYKKREINELKDETLEKVKESVESEGVVQHLVEDALTRSRVTEILDSRLSEIAEDLERQILDRIRENDLYNQRSFQDGDADLSDVIERG